jgi:hypothetical protein
MHRRRVLVLFAMAEIVLALAIPFVLIRGYHALLDSRTGTFVEEPTRADPGWAALVDPTEVIGVVEVDRGVVTGVTLLVHNPGQSSVGSAILVPGTLDLDGVGLDERTPADAVAAVSAALRLGVARVDVLDAEGWPAFLGETRYRLDNPDPVPGEVDGEQLLPVGTVEVGAGEAAAFVGRPATGAVPVSVLLRRELFWGALLADPPSTSTPLADDLAALDHQRSRVYDLPLAQLEPVAIVDPAGAELLIRDVVAYPAGSAEGDRLRVRVVDRTGSAALEDIAAAVAAQGIEVTEIANAAAFDDGETQIIAPVTLTGEDGTLPAELSQLSRSIGIDGVSIDQQPVDDQVVTLVVGRDFEPTGLS